MSRRYEIVAQPGCVEILMVSADGHREPVLISEMKEEHWRFVIDVARVAARHHTGERSLHVLATFNPTFVKTNSTEGGTG